MNTDSYKLALAICGVGRFATKRIIPAIAMCSNVELVAVIDPLGQEQFLLPGVRPFKSLEDYLDSKPKGAIYIATPNYLYAQHSIKSLLAGWNGQLKNNLRDVSHLVLSNLFMKEGKIK